MGKVKHWKKGGEEDKFIIRLIKQGKITAQTKPGQLKKDYPEKFESFSTNVMRNHLNILKLNNGLSLPAKDNNDSEEDENDVTDQEEAKSVANVGSEMQSESIGTERATAYSLHSYPIMCNVFKDPDNQFQKVVLAVLLPSGADKSRIELSEDGTVVFVKCTWAKTMFTMEDLSKKQLENNQITIHHPKILCFQESLEYSRRRVDMVPEAVIRVDLPIKVQTATDSWTRGGLKRPDGTDIVFAEFKGCTKEYNKKSNDGMLVYDL